LQWAIFSIGPFAVPARHELSLPHKRRIRAGITWSASGVAR
jgi:hypothetical protein